MRVGTMNNYYVLGQTYNKLPHKIKILPIKIMTIN
jgi:hypothetical protein